jgi:beta-carotene 3-hydroxylase
MNLITTLVFFAIMEGVAWFSHKYVMHGFLWILHKDHHQKINDSVVERNDFFFLLYAIPGIAGLFYGMIQSYNFYFWAGLGISLYGMCYFFVHDIFIHQRIKFLRNSNNPYLKALRRAHKMHHKHLGKNDGECFGMLIVPFKYFEKNNKKA